jgi:uncharacterized protein (DUF1499 family)
MRINSRILIAPITIVLTACAGQVPSDLGLINGSTLRPCPDKPNCVQTYDPVDEEHFMLPLTIKSTERETQRAISNAIIKTGGKIITEKALTPSGSYIHAEYQSDWLKFVDDVEVMIKNDLIHIRSASRLGYSDMGVNANRIKKIKTSYAE